MLKSTTTKNANELSGVFAMPISLFESGRRNVRDGICGSDIKRHLNCQECLSFILSFIDNSGLFNDSIDIITFFGMYAITYRLLIKVKGCMQREKFCQVNLHRFESSVKLSIKFTNYLYIVIVWSASHQLICKLRYHVIRNNIN